MLSALSLRAMPGIEWIDKDVWHRSVDVDGKRSSVAVAHLPERNSVLVTIRFSSGRFPSARFPSVKALPTIVARVRRVFDLGADIATIDSHLARDPTLAPLIRKRPGLRPPGDWESETMRIAQPNTPPAWRPWHAYAAQHLRMANHA
jgi:AraC family transcriptional regulator of adaptative response / DNA-3-methyladenine glycosylase II